MLTTSIVNVYDEREWCTDYGTSNWVLVYFNSVIKRVKQCCCTLILLPKSTLNANLTTTNRFITNDDWQRGRFENFESDHQYESNLESDVRSKSNRITKLRRSLPRLTCWQLRGTNAMVALRTPEYLAEFCHPSVDRRPGLRSADSGKLHVPRIRRLHLVTGRLPSLVHAPGTTYQMPSETRLCHS